MRSEPARRRSAICPGAHCAPPPAKHTRFGVRRSTTKMAPACTHATTHAHTVQHTCAADSAATNSRSAGPARRTPRFERRASPLRARALESPGIQSPPAAPHPPPHEALVDRLATIVMEGEHEHAVLGPAVRLRARHCALNNGRRSGNPPSPWRRNRGHTRPSRTRAPHPHHPSATNSSSSVTTTPPICTCGCERGARTSASTLGAVRRASFAAFAVAGARARALQQPAHVRHDTAHAHSPVARRQRTHTRRTNAPVQRAAARQRDRVAVAKVDEQHGHRVERAAGAAPLNLRAVPTRDRHVSTRAQSTDVAPAHARPRPPARAGAVIEHGGHNGTAAVVDRRPRDAVITLQRPSARVSDAT